MANVAACPAAPGFSGACSLFDPQPFIVDADLPNQAVQLRFPLGPAAAPGESFEAAMARLGPPCCDVSERRETSVDGRHAVFVVYRQREGVNAGLDWACYIIDHQGAAIRVCTTGVQGSALFTDRIAFLEQAFATLRFG
jgi:hypothetical protein